MSEETQAAAVPMPGIRKSLRRAPAFVVWTAVLTALWVVLTGADSGSWIIGIPAVAAALWAKSHLSHASIPRLSLLGLIRFLPFFFLESLKGGVDVARRVLGPRVRVNPGFVDYPLRLHGTSARVLFMDVVNLLPGTLTADIQGNRARIHTLDRTGDPYGSLMALEERVAALFDEPLAAPASART
ncbi:MAG: Na+/H+ antiporter subunit E [Bdellovibrio bacteriovorus]